MLLPLPNLIAFTAAAVVLTLTPGIDTALVLRTAVSEGRRQAMLAAIGIAAGCMAWGLAVALGLGALLVASELAYTALRWAGAAYLVWLGIGLLRRPRHALAAPAAVGASGHRRGGWLARGLLTNLLNPKVGVFYVSFLPQFIPAGADATFGAIQLAAIHVLLGPLWFGLLLGGGEPLVRWLRQPQVVARLDRATGLVFIAFGLRLALERRG